MAWDDLEAELAGEFAALSDVIDGDGLKHAQLSEWRDGAGRGYSVSWTKRDARRYMRDYLRARHGHRPAESRTHCARQACGAPVRKWVLDDGDEHAGTKMYCSAGCREKEQRRRAALRRKERRASQVQLCDGRDECFALVRPRDGASYCSAECRAAAELRTGKYKRAGSAVQWGRHAMARLAYDATLRRPLPPDAPACARVRDCAGCTRPVSAWATWCASCKRERHKESSRKSYDKKRAAAIWKCVGCGNVAGYRTWWCERCKRAREEKHGKAT